MNRFRTRKKSTGAGSRSETPSQDADRPAMPSLSSKSFRKKKQQPPPKLEFDLATALPSSDEFRTSLLMPKLSARFSMLREQDDPNSKLGKANDDSVLSPKRQSRIGYGFVSYVGGLADIAEVDSIKGSVKEAVRPPFANERVGSFASDGSGLEDDPAHPGGGMTRSRTREGNNLFGGRQKVYKIPVSGTASTKTLAGDNASQSSGGGMGGRFLYEYDVNPSSFNGLREISQEHEGQHTERDSLINRDSDEKDRASSPSIPGYNHNRETSSSTNSAPSNIRTSTAATSIASQGAASIPGSAGLPGRAPSAQGSTPPSSLERLERSTTKSRRLYEQGLDQQLQDQQSSALSRLEHLQRQRTLGSGGAAGGRLMHAQSATSLRDRYDRTIARPSPGATRNCSPIPPTSPTSITSYDLNRQESASRASGQDSGASNSRPMSPVLHPGMSEEDASTLAKSIQPQDRGKATALGAFNKPAKQFDEEDYSLRQLQLHGGKVSPALPSPLWRSSSPRSSPKKAAEHKLGGENIPNPSTSSSLQSPTTTSFQDQLLARQGGHSRHSSRPSGSAIYRNSATLPVQNGTFLAAPDGSDMSSQADSEAETEEKPTIQRTEKEEVVEGTHAQLAAPDAGRHSNENSSHWHAHQPSNFADITAAELDDLYPPNHSTYPKASSPGMSIGSLGPESPTLGPAAGLNGLVQQHLRTDSNTSSVYPAPSSSGSGLPRDPRRLNAAPKSSQADEYSRPGDSNPWNDWDGDYTTGNGSPLRNAPRHPSHLVPSPKSSKASQFFGAELPMQDRSEQWSVGHAREGSNETQREREAFTTELANRRKMIQQNLKNAAGNSRSGSPAPTSDSARDSPLRPPNSFTNILKPKSSRSSIKQEASSKAMRMLGIGHSNASTGTVANSSQLDNQQIMRQEDVPKVPVVPTPQMRKALRQYRQNAQKEAGLKRTGVWDSQSSPKQSSSPSPPTSRGSESGASSGPPRSRDGKTGNDPMVPLEENRSRANIFANVRNHFIENPPNASFAQNQGTGRPPLQGYFDKPLPAYQARKDSPLFPPAKQSRNPSPYESPLNSASTTPSITPSLTQTDANRAAAMRKKSVKKADISEPTLLSTTSTQDTINLPASSHFLQSSDTPPPVPPLNPRRKRLGKAQTVFDSLRGERMDRALPSPQTPDYSDEGFEPRGLKKSTSEGGGLNLIANQRAMTGNPQPPVPARNHTDPLQPNAAYSTAAADGAMF